MVSASFLEFSGRSSLADLLWQIFSWAAVNCSSGLTELWPVSDLRFLEGLVSREAIPFLIWLKSSVFRHLRAGCEEGMSSYELQRVHFPKDLIGESGDVPTHVFPFVPPPQREKKGFIKGDTPCLLRTNSVKE